MSRPAVSLVIGSRIEGGTSARPASRRRRSTPPRQTPPRHRQLPSPGAARHPWPAIRRAPSSATRAATAFGAPREAAHPSRAGSEAGFRRPSGLHLRDGALPGRGSIDAAGAPQAGPALVDVALTPAVLAALGTAAMSRSGRPAGNESPVAPPARFRLPCGSNPRGGWLRVGAGHTAHPRAPSQRAPSCVDDEAPAFRATDNAA